MTTLLFSSLKAEMSVSSLTLLSRIIFSWFNNASWFYFQNVPKNFTIFTTTSASVLAQTAIITSCLDCGRRFQTIVPALATKQLEWSYKMYVGSHHAIQNLLLISELIHREKLKFFLWPERCCIFWLLFLLLHLLLFSSYVYSTTLVCMCACSVMSNSLQFYGL